LKFHPVDEVIRRSRKQIRQRSSGDVGKSSSRRLTVRSTAGKASITSRENNSRLITLATILEFSGAHSAVI
jgi:hypothetical protein